METDYKIVEEREVNGTIEYQKVRFYQGATSTLDEYDVETNTLVPVTRYRRSDMYEEIEYWYE